MLVRSPLVILACIVGNVVACASIVQLDHSDELSAGDRASPDEGPIRTAENVTIDKPQLQFAFACGGNDSQSFTIKNEGDVAQKFSVAVDEATGFKIAGAASGTVEPGQSSTITVEASSAAAGALRTDIKVVIGPSERSVAMVADVKGARLTMTPAPADFGEVRKGSPSPPLAVLIKNEGTQETKISGFTGQAAAFEVPGGEIALGPGESKSVEFIVKADTALGPVTASLVPNATNLCAAAAPLQLNAVRVSTDVIVTAAVEFGDVGCRTTPDQPKTVRIENFAKAAITGYTATLKADSRFKITSNATGNVAAGKGNDTDPGRIEIALLPIPPGDAFGDSDEVLTIALPGATPSTRTVKLHERVFGARIETAATGDTNFTDSEDKKLRITNTGNTSLTVCYVKNTTSGSSDSWQVESTDTLGANGGNADIDVRFDPGNGEPTGNNYAATISVVPCQLPLVPLCQGGLPQLKVRGNKPN